MILGMRMVGFREGRKLNWLCHRFHLPKWPFSQSKLICCPEISCNGRKSLEITWRLANQVCRISLGNLQGLLSCRSTSVSLCLTFIFLKQILQNHNTFPVVSPPQGTSLGKYQFLEILTTQIRGVHIMLVSEVGHCFLGERMQVGVYSTSNKKQNPRRRASSLKSNPCRSGPKGFPIQVVEMTWS